MLDFRRTSVLRTCFHSGSQRSPPGEREGSPFPASSPTRAVTFLIPAILVGMKVSHDGFDLPFPSDGWCRVCFLCAH